MRDFGGSEPLVGEIVGLRTFRVDDSGLLLALYCEGVWYDGANTATCSPPTGRHDRAPHTAPADDCECGFYAYGSRAAAARNRQMRYVQAVVSCWGAVVAGTQGFRAEHARVDAIWLGPQAPEWLRVRVAQRYPTARLYADSDAMLREHPLTMLPGYEPPRPRRLTTRLLPALGAVLALVLGALPLPVLRSTVALEAPWLALIAATGLTVGWLVLGARGAGHLAAALVLAGVLGWFVAPLLGVLGWVLRLPLLRGLAVVGGRYLLSLHRRHFPVVRTPVSPVLTGLRS